MPRRIVAAPHDGISGTFEEDDGRRVEGVYRKVAYVYDVGEAVPPTTTTLGQLKARYLSATARSLVFPFADRSFAFGPELLAAGTDNTPVSVRTEFSYEGEPR